MKANLVSRLKRYPRLYGFMRRSYAFIASKTQHLRVCLLGSRVHERFWATRHLRRQASQRDDWQQGSRDWIEAYWDSRNHPHRKLLIDTITKYVPGSALELGSNCGPNLYLLGKELPQAQILGIDVNPMAVQKGNEWLAQENISNVKLLAGNADSLGQFPGKGFDIVFTDALLIYVGPNKIKKVVEEMIRVTSQALILVEWHCCQPNTEDPYGLGSMVTASGREIMCAYLSNLFRRNGFVLPKYQKISGQTRTGVNSVMLLR